MSEYLELGEPFCIELQDNDISCMNESSDWVKAVSLFSGIGGLDIGLHQAGIETVACVEKDDTAVKSLKINSKEHNILPGEERVSTTPEYPWIVIGEDIEELDADNILETADVDREEVDILVGGPPCQTFSRSNEGTRSGTDTERGKLYQEYARILHDIEPEAFIFENVRGLKSSNDGKDLKKIREELERGTYTTDYRVLNAADYGVPQTRKRIIIIGIKGDQDPEFPDRTHTENGEEDTKPWMTAGEALGDFTVDEAVEEKDGYTNAIGSKYGHLLKDIPEGANYQHFSERRYDEKKEEYVERSEDELEEKEFGWRTRHWNYLLKMDRQRPSWTLQAAPGTTVGPFHWRARKLSLMEQMKLMTIPLDYYIAGSPKDIQKQIGNAVPPKFAEKIAETLLDTLGLESVHIPEPDSSLHRPDADGADQIFKTEVESGTSPWYYADQILQAIHSKGSVVVQARQQSIPNAIDALEKAKRFTDRELDIEITESVEEGGKSGAVSVLEAKVVSDKAEMVVLT